MLMEHVLFLNSGDCALTLEFGQTIDLATNGRVRAAQLALERENIPGILESVPTYCALTVHYDPGIVRCDALKAQLRHLLSKVDLGSFPPSRVLEIPVLYGGEAGPDLPFVAQQSGLSTEEVIRRHSAPDYWVYMLGFTPGFPYLGGMDPALETPRLETPRVRIPGGSVGIAGKQTGVYPIDSPGGWQLIGQTPVRLYDPSRAEPILVHAGEYLKFCPISRKEFDQIAQKVAAGTFICRSYLREGEPL